ncbi:MAG TPA: SHOCT domain-containing protein [Acidimicrobiales bacterium]|nr:SHOCT domain-containing protein [Acidimicrobiales bacterium]
MPLRRRPVLRTVGRTAVIAGTASAVAGRVNRHQQEKWSEKDEQAYEEQQAAPAAAPAAGGSDELIDKLKELSSLKDQGILTEAEFNDQKAKILAQMS